MALVFLKQKTSALALDGSRREFAVNGIQPVHSAAIKSLLQTVLPRLPSSVIGQRPHNGDHPSQERPAQKDVEGNQRAFVIMPSLMARFCLRRSFVSMARLTLPSDRV